MKHKLIASFILFISFNAFSQDYKVTWSEEVKGDKLPQFAATNSKGEIITIGVKKLRKGIKKLKVKKYDKNLKLLKTLEQKEWESSSWKAKEYVMDGMMSVGDKIYCILYKKEKKQYLVYKNELTKDLKASDKIEQIGTFKHTAAKINGWALAFGYIILTPSNNNAIRYNFSKDKSKFILYNYFDQDKQKYVSISCFDKNFDKIWSKDINLKLNDRDIDVNNTVISNKGNVYINYEKTTKKGIFGGTLDYENHILQISDNGEKIKNIDLDFDKSIHVTKLYIDNNEYTETLNAMGFYSNNKSRAALNGIVNVVIDENTLDLETKNITKFTEQEYSYFYGKKRAAARSEKDAGLGNSLTLIGQYAMSDGGTIYLSEDFQIVEYNDGKRTYYRYYYGNILIIKTTPDGDIEWTKSINRSQGPFNVNMLQYLGSYSFVLDDKIYLMYNDDQSNIESQETSGKTKRTKNIKKAMAVLKIIDTDGNIKSDKILDGKEEDVIFSTSYSLKLNEQQLLLFANKKKLTKVGSLFVKELDEPLKYKSSKVKASETATKPEGIIQKVAEKSADPNGTGIDKSTETNPMEPSTNTSKPTIESKVANSSSATPEAKTPPAEAPKPVYTPSSVSPGRKATDSEMDFFNKLREQQPAAEPAK
jgi:tRNA A37 threonylcarbamoyladenosine modification protein TsaB